MDIIFYNHSKRVNSTSQPSSGDSYSVVLKNGSSIYRNPIVTIAASSFSYNYAYFNGLYYYVEDVNALRNGFYEVSLTLDPLASYKSEILNTSAFILYDETANTQIPDGRLPTVTDATMSMTTGSEIFSTSTTGCYVLTVNGISGTASFLMSKSDLTSLLDDLSNTIDDVFNGVSAPATDSLVDFFTSSWDGLKEIFGNVTGGGQVADCIKACVWLPYSFSGSGGTEITLGTFHTGHYGTVVTPILDLPALSVSIPWQFSDWRNASPYTQVGLYIPFIGTMYYDATNIKGISALTIERSLNLVTGAMCVEVKAGSSVLGSYGADVGCSYPIGVSNINWTSGITSVIGLAAAVATGGAAGAMMGVNGAAGIASALTPNQSTIGGLGGGAGVGLDVNIICFTVSHDTAEAPTAGISVQGTPTMTTKTLSALTGYVQTLNAHVEAAASKEILLEIEKYLNGGVYIE